VLDYRCVPPPPSSEISSLHVDDCVLWCDLGAFSTVFCLKISFTVCHGIWNSTMLRAMRGKPYPLVTRITWQLTKYMACRHGLEERREVHIWGQKTWPPALFVPPGNWLVEWIKKEV
jgi:hypothetical protein